MEQCLDDIMTNLILRYLGLGECGKKKEMTLGRWCVQEFLLLV